MNTLQKTLEIRTSPHIVSGHSTDVIMRNVVMALIPAAAFGVYAFGLTALLVIVTGLAACLATEHVLCRWTGKASTIGDWSVAITGLLYAMTLPPGLPLWMVFCGGVIAVALGKFAFGGLGSNVFNPALVGRAVLQAAFPVSMTTWMPAFGAGRFLQVPGSTLTLPFMSPVYDVATGATPLSAMKFGGQGTGVYDLAMGMTSGSLGETSAALILAGGVYLAARKMMNWRIPAAIFAGVYALGMLMHAVDAQRYPDGLFMLFSGGLMLGAVFMATDMVASPITSVGCWVYGLLIALLVVAIRLWGGLPEGMMYAILLGNAVSPHIDHLIRPRVYGAGKRSAT